MKICISATNPCHLYDLAVALHARGELGGYFSGYPAWRLQPPDGFPLVVRSARTLVTYGCLRLPAALRPSAHRLFRWQDLGFDRAVARVLEAAGGASIHAMPGQALATFRRARELGMLTVLNHASGPVRQRLAMIEDEYRRAGLDLAQHHGYDSAYFAREDAEYAAADYHCAASSIVRAQLEAAGVPPNRIWVVPYAADPAVFFPRRRRVREPRGGSFMPASSPSGRACGFSLPRCARCAGPARLNCTSTGGRCRTSPPTFETLKASPGSCATAP